MSTSHQCHCATPCHVCGCRTEVKPLQTKPLRDNLVGLQRKVERLDETRITQSLIECIEHILIETSRIDGEVQP